jgi:endonuclease G
VAYTLTKEKTKKLFNRSDKFIVDPQVTGTACNKDYSKSGYDRGHLAPAADMGWSSTAMAESFYYSNMSPQVPAFNRGIWKKLEELVRSWATENNTIYIATGPVLTSSLPTMGVNKISIPKYFYKVILDYSGQDIKGIGFIIPNLGSKEPIDHFAVSIDSVEKFTGIDFYPSLADKQEEIIEKNLCIKCWIWNTTKTRDIQKANNTTVAIPPINNTIGKTYIISSSKNSASTLQCSGITKSGGRCKRTTTNTNGRCYQH